MNAIAEESPPRTPVDPALLERAAALVKQFPECFWFRHPEAVLRWREDVRLVVDHLREYGGHAAWREAQALHTVTPMHSPWDGPSTFRKARVELDGKSVEIDWAADSAFRFFPIEPDPVLGWRLHLFDMATNKALALSARSETRDYVDIVELHRTFPLPAIIWAACGKDPGFSPLSLLKMMRRFARIWPEKLYEIMARKLDPFNSRKHGLRCLMTQRKR